MIKGACSVMAGAVRYPVLVTMQSLTNKIQSVQDFLACLSLFQFGVSGTPPRVCVVESPLVIWRPTGKGTVPGITRLDVKVILGVQRCPGLVINTLISSGNLASAHAGHTDGYRRTLCAIVMYVRTPFA